MLLIATVFLDSTPSAYTQWVKLASHSQYLVPQTFQSLLASFKFLFTVVSKLHRFIYQILLHICYFTTLVLVVEIITDLLHIERSHSISNFLSFWRIRFVSQHLMCLDTEYTCSSSPVWLPLCTLSLVYHSSFIGDENSLLLNIAKYFCDMKHEKIQNCTNKTYWIITLFIQNSKQQWI